jgi:ribosomal protein S18 acetylase RimI-like enzyme
MRHLTTDLIIQAAAAEQAAEFIQLRGLTRENAISEQRLRDLGITAESWGGDIRSGRLLGCVAKASGNLVGYCFGDTVTGEVVVLAVLPAHEGQGLGAGLLRWVVEHLRALGHTRLFLGCSNDRAVRSYGFYRHLGWKSTGECDPHGDEVLEKLG